MAGEDPGRNLGSRSPERGRFAWSVLLNAILVSAFVLGLIPIVAILHGFVDLVAQSKNLSGRDWFAYGLAFTGLLLGAVFFAYAIKYYLSTVMVLLTTLVGAGARNGNGNGHAAKGPTGLTRINGNENGLQLELGHHPFVSVQVAAYNEKRVIERLLSALAHLDYPNYEVVVVDDSTDESVEILKKWREVPNFKILHRQSRAGYKGGALREALKIMDPRTEYVVVFDADAVPFSDSIQRLLPLFYRVSDGTSSSRRLEAAFGRVGPSGGPHPRLRRYFPASGEEPLPISGEDGPSGGPHPRLRRYFPASGEEPLPMNGEDPPSEPGQIKRRTEVAAVQSYQWHVLNKSESWLTEAVRAEYAGSYMIERPFQDAIGSLKMIAGTAYMIRADVLREVGWGTSITEDWELTLKLYARGYKVVYTPWAETPAECVSTFSRLARQRMRWAEGHTYNVRKWFLPILTSPLVTPIEKLEFLYDSTYYLQAGLFVIGSISWFVSEVFFRAHVPGWTALLGWSLLFSNIFALPLMNLGGLVLEEAPARDVQGVFGAVVLSFALVPFQGWAAFKGLISRDEGPWFRTPKTGRVTDEVHHLRRLRMLGRWLSGRRVMTPRWVPPVSVKVAGALRLRRRRRWTGWAVVGVLALLFLWLGVASTDAPVVRAAGSPLFLHGSGTAPGCTATTVDQTPGARTPACQVQSAAGGVTTVWSWSGLPAQTVAAGSWTMTFDWTGGDGNTKDAVSVAAGVSLTGSCSPFVATIPAPGTTWTANYGAGLAPPVTSSPVTVTTSASQAPLVIPQGATLCIAVTLTHQTGGKPSMLYDGTAGSSSSITPPSIIVPESLLPLAGFAAIVPLFVTWMRRRRA